MEYYRHTDELKKFNISALVTVGSILTKFRAIWMFYRTYRKRKLGSFLFLSNSLRSIRSIWNCLKNLLPKRKRKLFRSHEKTDWNGLELPIPHCRSCSNRKCEIMIPISEFISLQFVMYIIDKHDRHILSNSLYNL